MPANSTLLQRFSLVLTAGYGLMACVNAQLPRLPTGHYEWLGQQVFANECNRQPGCLTHWNDGEDFPSLGIGHFIWYRQGQSEVFEETFPDLLQFMQQRGVVLPHWLQDPLVADNPWSSKADFLAAADSPPMHELNRLLHSTMNLQAAFIAERLDDTSTQLIASVPTHQQDLLRQTLEQLAAANPPMGIYALIDYLHFKGSGLKESEQYRQQGWGLKQVLLRMHPDSATLDNFVSAASAVLTERVANAPPGRDEQRWLRGWHKRLQTYLQEPHDLETHDLDTHDSDPNDSDPAPVR